MNIAVCDDEESARIYMKKLIEMQDMKCRIIEFASGGELLQFWEKEDREEIDLIFLDISMEGIDGIEVAEQIRKWKEDREETLWGSLPLLIFVTSHPEYMSKAFSLNAFHYLLKPVNEKEFEDVFARAAREYRYLEVKKNAEPRKILVRNGKATRKILADDIYYMESNNRKIIMFMQDGKIECYGKIGEFEKQLKEGFFRIHRGYLVNMKHVESYSRTEVRVKNGSRLLISKYKYQEFVKAYMKYISENEEG